ncbi:MAG: iron uptake porin, partial [Synechococcus sp. SP1 MAG]|nr:iron uptake porin [Synechococcus sp. SP1 MAG]
NWVLGAAKYHGNGSDAAATTGGGTSFSYNLALNLETSFTGKDLLYTRLRAGNMDNVYGANGLFAQEYGFDSDNAVEVNRLYYSFPIGDEFTVVGGPMVRMDDMLPVWPSAYPSDMTFDFFTYAGAPGAYNLALGAGAGVYWESEGGFSVSTSYLSVNGNSSCPNTDICVDDEGNLAGGGIGTDAAAFSATTQIAYAPENWGIAAAYTKASGVNGVGLYQGNSTIPAALISYLDDQSNSFGLSAWWMPEESGWVPSISVGYGGSWLSFGGDDAYTNSWYVGLEWDDALMEGNSFGIATGQPTYIVSIDGDDYNAGAGYAWEFFYKFQVTDNITVTPAIHYLSKPYAEQDSNGLNAMSGLVKTTFKF